MTLDKKFLKKIKGDASFRSFYRKEYRKKKSIIVAAKKEKKKNLLIYDAINKLLIKNGIKAPKLLNHNYHKNYILPVYSKKLIADESKLFLKWYIPNIFIKKKALTLNKKLTTKINLLLSKLKLKNNTFVHRDFHVSNLMKLNKKIGILDSQDAVYGNKAYDLASLIDDVRLKTSLKLKNSIYNYYVYLNKKGINKNHFRNDFEILSVLRNLKVIGIFTRLAVRDDKKSYLKLIPYAWKLIENRINNNLIFADLKNYLDANFSKKIRMKK